MQSNTDESRGGYQTLPNIIYKFLPPEGLIALTSKALKCTHPRDFNDTWDSFHVVSDELLHGINIIGSPIYFQKTDPATLLPPPGAREEFRAWFAKSVEAYPGMALEIVNLLPPMREEGPPSFREGVRGQLKALEERYVLSLTQRFDAPTMWDYYAAGHRGFVLGFSSDSSFLKLGKEKSLLRRVIYTDQASTGPWEVAIWRRWLLKRTQYAHEEEWRAMYLKKQLREVQPELFVTDFSADDLVEIIIGSRADNRTIDVIMSAKPAGARVFQEFIDGGGKFSVRPIS